MICLQADRDKCAGISPGNLTMPRPGMRMQLKSMRNNEDTLVLKMGFVKHMHGIRPILNLTLGVGPSGILVANESRILRWNHTAEGRIQSGTLCLTAMRCENRLPDDEAQYCNINSEYPIWNADEVRRGVRVTLYPCLYRMLGQRWNVFPQETQLPTSQPTVLPTVRAPSSSPSTSPTFGPSFLPSHQPSFGSTTIPTFSPSKSPSITKYNSPTTVATFGTPSLSPTLRTASSQVYENVEAAPLYAIPVAIGLLIALITIVIWLRIRANKKE